LKKELIRVEHEWGLENKVVAYITDNASYIIKAVECEIGDIYVVFLIVST